MQVWYPKAVVRKYLVDGGPMEGGPGRIIDHTTETVGVPRYGGYDNPSNSAPHVTIDRDGTVYQHQPINRASRALRNEPGGVQTNRMGKFCVQKEHVTYAKNGSQGLTEPQRRASREFNIWVSEQTGIPLTWTGRIGGGYCYGSRSICRMTQSQWRGYTGLSFHGEVPENTHWDCGPWDFAYIMRGADMATEHEHDLQKLIDAHKIEGGIPEWGKQPWDDFIKAGGTSVPDSWRWPAFRLDFSWFYAKLVEPLRREVVSLRTRVSSLENEVAGLRSRVSNLEARPVGTPVTGDPNIIKAGQTVRLERA